MMTRRRKRQSTIEANKESKHRIKRDKPRKLNRFETYVALIKGYCALTILTLPKSFQNGGYIFAPINLFISGILTTICVEKLILTGLKYEIYCYSQVVGRVLGPRGRLFLDIMIFMTQYCATIAQSVFIIQSFASSLNTAFGWNTPQWYYAMGLVCILTPIAWVRDISKFSFTFMLGNTLLMATVITVIVDCVKTMNAQGGVQADIIAFNEQAYLSCVGFSIFAFEGIGVVMPIMQSCAEPKKFISLLYGALITLTIVYVSFGLICYLAYGDQLQNLITENLPSHAVSSITMKLAYSVNVIFGYAISIKPANQIWENWIFNRNNPQE